MLAAAFMPASARADTPALALAMMETPEAAPAMTAAAVATGSAAVRPLPPGIWIDTTVRWALVARDDSGTVWVQLPVRRQQTGNPGLLDLDARQLRQNPDMAEATASRTINTIAEVADDYRFGRFASVMRTLNDKQQTTYTHLEEWHEQYIENYNIDVRRTRDEVLGGYLYVFGYQQSF